MCLNNHGISIRAAVEARLISGVLSLKKDPKKLKELGEKYWMDPQNLQGIKDERISYKFRDSNIQDRKVEGFLALLGDISLPVMGAIKVDRSVGKDGIFFFEGDDFGEPFLPFGTFPQTDGTYNYRGLQVFSVDSFGGMLSKGPIFDSWCYTPGLVPELDAMKPDFNNWSTYRRDKMFQFLHDEGGNLRKILQNEEVGEYLKRAAKFFVLSALFTAKFLVRDPIQGMMGFENHMSHRGMGGPIRASVELQKTICEAAIALCEEYLSEMEQA